MKKDKGTTIATMALCLNCIISLEDVGYEAEQVSEGMISCQNCGKRCWGKTVRLRKSGKGEQQA